MQTSGQPVVADVGSASAWDHSTDERFLQHYSDASVSPLTLQRFANVKLKIEQLCQAQRIVWPGGAQVLDVGCGAGTQCGLWARDGHQVHGLDVNGPLLQLAQRRCADQGLDVQFHLGTATSLPFGDAAFDVVLIPELLEHIQDWQSALAESLRVLRPGGVLYLSTSSYLCPVQQEFNLPGYSWYPAPIKRYVERLSVTTRPDLANFARYPAVNWFSYFQLRRWLAARGVHSRDRFDMIDAGRESVVRRWLIAAIQTLAPLRWVAHLCTEGTTLFGIKRR